MMDGQKSCLTCEGVGHMVYGAPPEGFEDNSICVKCGYCGGSGEVEVSDDDLISDARRCAAIGQGLGLHNTLIERLADALSAAAVRYRAEGEILRRVLKAAVEDSEATANEYGDSALEELRRELGRDPIADLRALLDENNETQEN